MERSDALGLKPGAAPFRVRGRRCFVMRCLPLDGGLDLCFGGFALAEFAAAFGLGVQFGADEERDRAKPEPDQHHDHGGEGAPRLVVWGEEGGVDGEDAGGEEPDRDGDDRAGGEELPAGMLDVRPEGAPGEKSQSRGVRGCASLVP